MPLLLESKINHQEKKVSSKLIYLPHPSIRGEGNRRGNHKQRRLIPLIVENEKRKMKILQPSQAVVSLQIPEAVVWFF
jgi:hypothetical protein